MNSVCKAHFGSRKAFTENTFEFGARKFATQPRLRLLLIHVHESTAPLTHLAANEQINFITNY